METYEEMLARHRREKAELADLSDLSDERRTFREEMLATYQEAEIEAYPNHPMFDAPVETPEEEEQRINGMLSDEAYQQHLIGEMFKGKSVMDELRALWESKKANSQGLEP